MNIGERLRWRRKELNMTLEEVAQTVNVSRQTLSRYENGIISNIPSDKIEALAKALKTSPAYIMGWEDTSNFTTTVAQQKLNLFGDIIADFRSAHNMSISKFAELSEISPRTVVMLERGHCNPSINIYRKVAKVLDVSVDDLIRMVEGEITLSTAPASNLIPISDLHMKKVPLIGTIACGSPILAEENITDYIDAPGHIRADFALMCRGDSMIGADIRSGDIVFIRQQPEVSNGQIAAVLVEDEATLKRFYHSGTTVTLLAENPEIAPLVYAGEELEHLHVIGLAVATLHQMEP